MHGTIAVIATMDTKGLEAEFLREKLQQGGYQALLLDVSTYRNPVGTPDVSADEIAEAGGSSREELLAGKDREKMMAVMGAGAAEVLKRQYRHGKLKGVLGIGGNQGTAIASIGMRALPIGFPKYLISTVASGNIRPFVGAKDIAMVFSVSDLVGGPNVVTRSVLANAAAAVMGMADAGESLKSPKDQKLIAISALGNTEEAVNHAMTRLKEAGFQVIAFHASGAGGSAMEELVERGIVDGVLDLTPHELTEEVIGQGAYVPVNSGRMEAAVRKGIPLVVATGGMEYVCFGPRNSIPRDMLNRKILMHNPYNANVIITHDELQEVAAVLAERLNKAGGKTALFVPTGGWSKYGSPGGVFYDPEGLEKFLQALRSDLDPKVRLEVPPGNINDEGFVDLCVDAMIEFMKEEK